MQSVHMSSPFSRGRLPATRRAVQTFIGLVVLTFLVLPSSLAAQGGSSIELTGLASEQRGGGRTIVVDRPGRYTLGRSGAVRNVEIVSDNVTFDLNGQKLRGRGEFGTVAISITGARNVKVHNGLVSDFGIGVQVVDSVNVEIADLQIAGSDQGGAPPNVEMGVLIVDSRGVVVHRNTITETFLGVFVRGVGSAGNYIADNVITGGDNGELAICYNPAPGESVGGPSGDLIEGNLISRFRRGFSFSEDSIGNVLVDNTFAFFDLGIVEASAGSNVINDNVEIQIAR